MITRLNFLRGTGVSLALPWLESLAAPALRVHVHAQRRVMPSQ